jgi:hypothetical protein
MGKIMEKLKKAYNLFFTFDEDEDYSDVKFDGDDFIF